ncbi:MAG: response regulator [Arthrospira sp. SH-MAG29]|nr:response regulator [Arthrospira sp. SH-MAG29]MBS0017680.1 response regulator [Arthrospira sp. SH-MAG29]
MSKPQILVIDDEERIREIVRVCMTDLGGWDVITANSGQEGLQKAKTEHPDAILLDVSMPDLDGFELVEQLQYTPSCQEIPVIMLTAKVLKQDRDRFEKMDITGVITKPFNPLTLAQQVANLLATNSD